MSKLNYFLLSLNIFDHLHILGVFDFTLNTFLIISENEVVKPAFLVERNRLVGSSKFNHCRVSKIFRSVQTKMRLVNRFANLNATDILCNNSLFSCICFVF